MGHAPPPESDGLLHSYEDLAAQRVDREARQAADQAERERLRAEQATVEAALAARVRALPPIVDDLVARLASTEADVVMLRERVRALEAERPAKPARLGGIPRTPKDGGPGRAA